MPPIEIERARRPLGGQLRHHLARHGFAAGLVVDRDDGDVRAVRFGGAFFAPDADSIDVNKGRVL